MPRSGERVLAAVLFTDIVGSTTITAALGDARWRSLLDRHHSIARQALKDFEGELMDTAGDGLFATFRTPAAAIRCACRIAERVQTLGIDIRAGVHFGETEPISGKLGGITVVTCSRVMSVAGPGEVLVTATAREMAAGSGFVFEDRGSRLLKGIEQLSTCSPSSRSTVNLSLPHSRLRSPRTTRDDRGLDTTATSGAARSDRADACALGGRSDRVPSSPWGNR